MERYWLGYNIEIFFCNLMYTVKLVKYQHLKLLGNGILKLLIYRMKSIY